MSTRRRGSPRFCRPRAPGERKRCRSSAPFIAEPRTSSSPQQARPGDGSQPRSHSTIHQHTSNQGGFMITNAEDPTPVTTAQGSAYKHPWRVAVIAGLASYVDGAALTVNGIALVIYQQTIGLTAN